MSIVDTSAVSLGEKIATTAIDRRRLIGAAALTVAGMAAAPAFALAGETGLSTYRGRYAIQGGRVLDGFFAAPKGKNNLGIVVVMADQGTSQAQIDAAARRHAQAGFVAIAPDVAATYRGAKSAAREVMVADLMTALPNLKYHPLGNGRVTVVNA